MPSTHQGTEVAFSDRMVRLGSGTAAIPERLLLEHAKGNVLFVTGAGISMFKPAGLPDFRGLVLSIYEQLDPPTFAVLSLVSNGQGIVTDSSRSMIQNLNDEQKAEVLRFCGGDYDVVLGMLERRLDRSSGRGSRVRASVGNILRTGTPRPAAIHKSLICLADRGSSTTIVTTNFDLLLEDAAKNVKSPIQTYALGGIPRPTQNPEFGGVMHIHGALNRNPKLVSDLILTDRDLGEFYLRRRIVPDLIYDAARLYNLVLVGYSANDPPMRYLLNAVAADRERFTDLKERFIFVGYEEDSPIELSDLKARGLTPIPYQVENGSHRILEDTLVRWAELSAINGNSNKLIREIKRITDSSRMKSIQEDRDLFDFVIRRSHATERNQIANLLSSRKADPDWLDATLDILFEHAMTQYGVLLGSDSEFGNMTPVNLVFSFLRGRLKEKGILKWAIEMTGHEATKKSAIKLLLEVDGANLHENWRTAWRTIEESWNSPVVDPTYLYYLQDRLRAGERTVSLITGMVELVRTGIGVKLQPNLIQSDRRIRSFRDLIEVSLTSGDLVDPKELDLHKLNSKDKRFLISLAIELDAAVTSGLESARRAGWTGDEQLWILGGLYRVANDDTVTNFNLDEPDAHNNGIAPSVKLLHAVVKKLAGIDVEAARRILWRWKTYDDPVHLRLWASISCDNRITDAREVGNFLIGLNDNQFWLVDSYPEIAEIRARRFLDLECRVRESIVSRICRLVPVKLFSRKFRSDIDERIRVFPAAIELKRIQSAGGTMISSGSKWLETMTRRFPELSSMDVTSVRYRNWTSVQHVLPRLDSSYDDLSGTDRLRKLEKKLSKSGGGRGNGAETWMQSDGNAMRVICDLESTEVDIGEFPKVWEHLGWSHSPWTDQGEYDTDRELTGEAESVVRLLLRLPEGSLNLAVRGAVNWLDTWRELIVKVPEWEKVWCCTWSIVQEHRIAETQSWQTGDERSLDDRDWLDMDTLNTSEGKLVEVFLAACRYQKAHNKVYSEQSDLICVRNSISNASGKSKYIAIVRLTICVDFFLNVDSDWAQEHLVAPLLDDTQVSLASWLMISRTLRSTRLLTLVGDEMIRRTTDWRLQRTVRQDLAYNLIFELIHAFQNKRTPAIDHLKIQQMLRTIDDETRSFCANKVSRLLCQLGKEDVRNKKPANTVTVLRNAIKPFFDQVWPKEKAFVTPNVSKGLASLPACANEAFAEAVDLVFHLLVPFDCRSLYMYGLRSTDDSDQSTKLSMIDDQEKAEAFLRLLDRTIDTVENAIYPYELGDALAKIKVVKPQLARSRAFKRLTTLARR